jgi:hypothetical protein
MSSPVPENSKRENTGLSKMSDNVGSLDVGWLLHSKKGELRVLEDNIPPEKDRRILYKVIVANQSCWKRQVRIEADMHP